MNARQNYSVQLADWLVQMGYSHCFFLAGGNIMHFLESARERFCCIPVINEVSAGIAAEYFNVVSPKSRAFALVTAGPGLTNIVTAAAGAFTESRELLILGGQVKSSDLARGSVRQRGIQEIDGTALMAPICKDVIRIEDPISRNEFEDVVRKSFTGRPGTVFVEMCLDAQGAPEIPETSDANEQYHPDGIQVATHEVDSVVNLILRSKRPIFLFGGGLAYQATRQILNLVGEIGIPVATTYNGADRFDSAHPLYFGRPNTWGMRWANVLLQQSDVIVALGTRLGLQQTGFNWEEFGPKAKIVQVDIDNAELTKGHPRIDLAIQGDAGAFLKHLLTKIKMTPDHATAKIAWEQWVTFGHEVRQLLPLDEDANVRHNDFWNPYSFMAQFNQITTPDDIIIPCSSGGAFTATYQTLLPKMGQRIVSNKSLASMGYGLGGAIGAAISSPSKRVLHIEGDGGFAQNLSELGTVKSQQLSIKSFIWVNEGYASIRMTQRNYFDGAWMGCDRSTGVGLPDLPRIFDAYDIPNKTLSPLEPLSESCAELLSAPGPASFIVPLHPEQTFYPKISSRVTPSGSMESNPLHLMSPALPDDIQAEAFRFLGEK